MASHSARCPIDIPEEINQVIGFYFFKTLAMLVADAWNVAYDTTSDICTCVGLQHVTSCQELHCCWYASKIRKASFQTMWKVTWLQHTVSDLQCPRL